MSSNCVKWASHAAETKRKELKPTDSSVGTESALISVYSLIPWDRALELLIKALALLFPITHSLSCNWVRPRDQILADGIELEAMCPFRPSCTLPWLFLLTLCSGPISREPSRSRVHNSWASTNLGPQTLWSPAHSPSISAQEGVNFCCTFGVHSLP